MNERKYTDMGRGGGAFLTTHWSLIEGIQAGEGGDRFLIGRLLEQYWKPVYCFLRQKGYGNEQSKDLTQGFFHEVVLQRQLTQRADESKALPGNNLPLLHLIFGLSLAAPQSRNPHRRIATPAVSLNRSHPNPTQILADNSAIYFRATPKGRFRSFLLHALRQYVADQTRREKAHKRGAGYELVPMDMVDPDDLPQIDPQEIPEESFNYAWKTVLLDRVLSQVKADCLAQGLEVHWQAFQDRVVQPTLEEEEAPSLGKICARYVIEDETKPPI